MSCAVCGRFKQYHGSENHSSPCEFGCHEGVLMDDDTYFEGWQPDVIYQPCYFNPFSCQFCKGTGVAPKEYHLSEDCPSCDGTGWKDRKPQWPTPAPAPAQGEG